MNSTDIHSESKEAFPQWIKRWWVHRSLWIDANKKIYIKKMNREESWLGGKYLMRASSDVWGFLGLCKKMFHTSWIPEERVTFSFKEVTFFNILSRNDYSYPFVCALIKACIEMENAEDNFKNNLAQSSKNLKLQTWNASPLKCAWRTWAWTLSSVFLIKQSCLHSVSCFQIAVFIILWLSVSLTV